MKPVAQTITAPPTGNCLAACVATLFDLPIWLVPNFVSLDRWRYTEEGDRWQRTNEDKEPLWWDRLCAFASEEGWRVIQLTMEDYGRKWGGRFMYGDHAIATVNSPRGHGQHCVIAEILTGEVVWDPHPEGWSEGQQLRDEDIQDWLLFFVLK